MRYSTYLPMEKHQEKQQLRNKYKAFRSALSETELEEQSLAIANNALNLDIWHYEYYHLFLPITQQKEINTHYLLHVLQGKDKQIIVSKSDFAHKQMVHYLLTDSTRFLLNTYGIPEPQNGIEVKSLQMDVVFVPLLAYDLYGNRVGYGQGFYDRFLAECRPETVKIGLSFFEPEPSKIHASEQDILLDFVISPLGIIDFYR